MSVRIVGIQPIMEAQPLNPKEKPMCGLLGPNRFSWEVTCFTEAGSKLWASSRVCAADPDPSPPSLCMHTAAQHGSGSWKRTWIQGIKANAAWWRVKYNWLTGSYFGMSWAYFEQLRSQIIWDLEINYSRVREILTSLWAIDLGTKRCQKS